MYRATRLILAALLLSPAPSGCSDDSGSREPEPVIGLDTSLPILWPESEDLSGLLDGDAGRHWALDVLERHGKVQPVDDLAAAKGGVPLETGALLVMIQPMPLAPDENVALDSWIRKGGRLLLFADPMLTGHSQFALGDKRRPQDVVLLSPILARWGLALQFDEGQPAGERSEALFGMNVPVNLSGHFAPSGNSRDCEIEEAAFAASCRVGEGRVLAIADAALFEEAPPEEHLRRSEILGTLLQRLEIGD